MKQSIDYKAVPNTNLGYEFYRLADAIIVIAKECTNPCDFKSFPVDAESDKPLPVKYYLISSQKWEFAGDYHAITQEEADKLTTGLTQLLKLPEVQSGKIDEKAAPKSDKPKETPVVPEPARCDVLRPGFHDKQAQTDGYFSSISRAGNAALEKMKKWNKKDVGLVVGSIAAAGIALFVGRKYMNGSLSSSQSDSLKLKK